MKNYADMSDQEINQAVTCEIFKCHAWSLSETGGSFFHCGIDGAGYYVQQVVDYCNSWDDAGPIIFENHINISWCGDDEWSARTVHLQRVFDKNPLRAAMIVFLMMKDA